MFCPYCGAQMADGSEYCGVCGRKFTQRNAQVEGVDSSCRPTDRSFHESTGGSGAAENQVGSGAQDDTVSGPKKHAKRPPRILIIALSIVVSGVVVFCGVYYWLGHHSLGKLPDPECFLGMEADEKSVRDTSIIYTFYTTQDPAVAAEAFSDLLLGKLGGTNHEKEYKVVYEGCTVKEDRYIVYDFSYDGWTTAVDESFVRVFADYSDTEEGYNSLLVIYLADPVDLIEIVEDGYVWDGEFVHADAEDDAGASGETPSEADDTSAAEISADGDADSGETETTVDGEAADPDEDDGASNETEEKETQSSDSASGKTLLAAALSAGESQSASTPDASDTRIQSLDAFAGSNLSYSGPSSSGNYTVYNLTGDADDYDVVKEYVELLSGGTMNLELVDYYEKTISSTYFSCALNYTGTATVTETSTMNFADDVTGNVTLYGTIEKSKLKVSLWVPDSMEATDFGWRYGGGTEETTAAGESAYAGLYLLADGTYQTSDGRLSTVLGEADIFMDGTEIISDAEYEADSTKEALKVYDFYLTESVYFTVPYRQLLAGDVYTFDDLRGDHSSKENNNWGPEGFNMGTAFAVLHNGNWRYPQYDDSQIEDVTVRVMYYEEDTAAVFYCYVLLTSSPYEIEFLAAVDLAADEEEAETETAAATSSDSGTATCWSCNGTGKCSACNGKGYKVRLRGGEQTEDICAGCVGSGKCPYCGGDGEL